MANNRPRGRVTSVRDPWLDNAKMLLVTLVVVRHSWMLLPSNGPEQHLADFLYSWHMPAFVLVTGYLSRSFDYTPRRVWHLVRTVAVPLLVFEGLMLGFRVLAGGAHVARVGDAPTWPLWFLAALICWRLLAPVFRRVPGAVPLAVVISLLAGLGDLTAFDLARMLGLLPFFVVGLMATPERLELLRRPEARVLALATFAGIWVLAGHTEQLASGEWLVYKDSYDALGAPVGHGLLIRSALLVVGTAGSLAFLALVPRRDGWFARMGEWTLVVYLFHPFAVRAAEYAGLDDWGHAHPLLAWPIVSAAAVVVALLLAHAAVARRLRHVVDPFGPVEQQVDLAAELAQVEPPEPVLAGPVASLRA